MCVWVGGITEVLKEFAAKKCVKLGKLLKETGGLGVQMKHRDNRDSNSTTLKVIYIYILIINHIDYG